MTLDWMPLIGYPLAINMGILNQRQAKINHNQTLERLAERGGLSFSEAAAIASNREWQKMTLQESLDLLKKRADAIRLETVELVEKPV